MLLLDLFVFHKKSHIVSIKEAALLSVFWITLALIFNVIILFWLGKERALEYLTGYLIEKSLSVDNLFVFLMIFSHFKVPAMYQHRVLSWGIIGAIVLRGVMIFAGVALVTRFHWVLYIFGIFLLYAALKMAFGGKKNEEEIEDSSIIRYARSHFNLTSEYNGDSFWMIKNGMKYMTPMVPVIMVIESSDLMFAFDSIPAIFAVTTDPIIVFTSNIFAILGLRSLYFLLADVMRRFVYLEKGLAVILAFVGVKILIEKMFPIPTTVSLMVIVIVMAISIFASARRNKAGSTAATK